MLIQVGGGDGMDDLNHGVVTEVDAGGGEQFRVEGEELVRVLICPQSQPLHATDHGERPCESVDHILPTEPIVLAGGGADRILLAGLGFDDVESVVVLHA